MVACSSWENYLIAPRPLFFSCSLVLPFGSLQSLNQLAQKCTANQAAHITSAANLRCCVRTCQPDNASQPPVPTPQILGE